MKTIVPDWYLVREAEKKGLVASMTSTVERNRTDLNDELSNYFREKMPNYDSVFGEDECEDILYSLNDYIEDNNIKSYSLDFPVTEGSDVHLIKINENIQLKVLISDEYYGSGVYEKYIEIGYFIINESTTKKDVDELIDFVRDYLTL